MHHSKPLPLTIDAPRQVCPVCGTRSYSPGGIHPQCAMQQADAPRMERIRRKWKLASGAPRPR